MEKRKPARDKSKSSDGRTPSDSKKSNPVAGESAPQGRRVAPDKNTAERNSPAEGGKHPGSTEKQSESNPDEPRGSTSTTRQAAAPATDVDAPSTSPDATTKSSLNPGAANETELPNDEPL